MAKRSGRDRGVTGPHPAAIAIADDGVILPVSKAAVRSQDPLEVPMPRRHARPIRSLLAGLAVALAVAPVGAAQDLYDPGTLRTFQIQFNDANWLQLLRQNYTSGTNILATLTVDGVSYPNVGVRIRGNTSYTALPTGSEKFSLKIDMDFVDPNQELMGYDSINLNNGFRDPTFMREFAYNNYVARFIPNSRANHVLVTLNGQN
jgi:spore coat protein CotH